MAAPTKTQATLDPGARPLTMPALHLAQTPQMVRRTGRILLAVLILLPIGLLLVPWQQNISGRGYVSAYAPIDRQQPVEAPISGRIADWNVQEGSVVQEGQLLGLVSDFDPNYLERLKLQEQAAQAQLDAAGSKVQTYTDQLESFKELMTSALSAQDATIKAKGLSINAKQQKVENLEFALDFERKQLERMTELRKSGIGSERDLELQKIKVNKVENELDLERLELEAADADLEAARQKRGEKQAEIQTKIQKARADLQSATKEVADGRDKLLKAQVTRTRQESQEIRAPCAGTVFRLQALRRGDVVKAGDQLLTIVPDTQTLGVELWVDGNDMPLITPGDNVRLQFEGWPAVQFAGWPSVAVGTFGGEVAFVDATDDGKGKFRILVLPDPDDQEWPSKRYLRQGVRTKAWVLLRQVTLGYELWRQVNGFPPVIAQQEPKPDKGLVKELKVQ